MGKHLTNLQRIRNLTIVIGLISLMLVGAVLPSFLNTQPVDAAYAIAPGQAISGEGMAPSTTVVNYHKIACSDHDNDNGNLWSATIAGLQSPFPTTGTLHNLKVVVGTATTAGNYVFTILKNGVDTGLSVTLAIGETEEYNADTYVSVSAGDILVIRSTPTAPTGLTKVFWSFLFTPTTSQETVIFGNAHFRSTGSITSIGYSTVALVSGPPSPPFPVAGTLRAMYIKTAEAVPAGNTFTATVWRGGVATSMQVVISEGEDSGYIEMDLAISAGQIVYLYNISAAACQIAADVGYVFMADDVKTSVRIGAATGSMSAVTTRYFGVQGYEGAAGNVNEADSQTAFRGGSVVAAYVLMSIAPGVGKSYDWTLMRNGVATSATMSVSGTGKTASWVGEIELDDMDTLSWRAEPIGTPLVSGGQVSMAMTDAIITDTNAITDFVATPISASEIKLTWHDPNNPTTYPDLMVLIKRKTSSYPITPPGADSTQVYYMHTVNGNCEYIDTGLQAGTTYYYRIWRYDSVTAASILDDQDWATTYAGSTTPDSPDEPDTWRQAPSCDIYNKWFVGTPMNAAADTMGMTRENFCVLMTLLFIGALSAMSFAPAAIGQMSQPRTIAVPFITVSVLIVVAAVAGALPLYLLGLLIFTGGVAVYLWTRV